MYKTYTFYRYNHRLEWKPASFVEKKNRRRLAALHGPEGGRYDSNNGIKSVYLSPFWDCLSMVARNFAVHPTRQQRLDAHMYVLALASNLPCGVCRNSLQFTLYDLDYRPTVHLRDRQSFSRFVNDLHNAVNKKLGKRMFSYEEHRDIFENMRSRECHSQRSKKTNKS